MRPIPQIKLQGIDIAKTEPAADSRRAAGRRRFWEAVFCTAAGSMREKQEIIQTERGKHIKLLFIKSQMGQFAGDNCVLTQITGSNTGDVRNAESRKTGQRCSAEHRHRQN